MGRQGGRRGLLRKGLQFQGMSMSMIRCGGRCCHLWVTKNGFEGGDGGILAAALVTHYCKNYPVKHILVFFAWVMCLHVFAAALV